MKKICSLALVLALILGLSVPAFADNSPITGAQPGTTPIEITGTYQEGEPGGTVFSIDITWEAMSFTYEGESKKTWDPEKHEYKGDAKEAGWTEDSEGTITVTNHSNAFLQLSCSYTAEASYGDTKMSFEYDDCVPDSSSIGLVRSAELGSAQTSTITVKPTAGSLPDSISDNTKIGTVTLTISEWTEPDFETVTYFYEMSHNQLDNSFNGLGNDADYDAASNAVRDLNLAIGDAETPPTGVDYAKMINAYIEALSAMTVLQNKYSTSTP